MSGAPFEYSMSRRQALTLLGASAIVPFDSIKAATAPSSEALHTSAFRRRPAGSSHASYRRCSSRSTCSTASRRSTRS
jgi:hypothetical protein